MSLAPGTAAIGLRRLFTSPGVDPYDEVVWERRDARITNWKDGTVAFEQLGVEFPVSWSLNATNIVAQKYFRGTLGTAERESSLRQVIDRVVDTITTWGVEGGYFVDEAEAEAFSDELKYILVTQRAAFNSPVWFNIGVQGRAAAGQRLLHPGRRRHDGLDPQLVPGRGRDLQGRLGLRRQPVEDPLQRRAARGRRHGVRSGELHARRRRVGRHDQVRRQDPPGGEDGHPRRRPPRRRGVHLVQGQGGAQGAGAARRRLRHGPRRRRLVLDPVPERQQLGAGHRRVHAGRASTTPTGTCVAVTTGEVLQHASGPATCGARSPRRRGSAPTPACSSTPRSTAGTPPHTTGRINGTNPCSEYMHLDNSACNLASINLLKYLDERRHVRRRRLPAHGRGRVHRPGDPGRPRRLPDASRSPRRAASSASSASATPTSARC